MKSFKKALIATAVLSTFGAQAVSLTSKINNHVSQQGLDAGNDAIVAIANEQELRLQFSPGVETPAASTITLTFNKEVDLGDLHTASSTIDNAVTDGQGKITIAGATNTYFNYGTGDSTFDSLDVDTTAGGQDYIEFVINDGNALEVNSSFSLVIEAMTNGVEITGADEVCYKSVSPSDDVLEEGCFPFSDIKDQFAFAVTQEFNGKINRTQGNVFSKDYEGTVVNDDNLVFKLTTDESLAASIDDADVEMTLEANFTNVNDFSANVNFAGAVTVTGEDEVTFDITNAEIDTAAPGADGEKKVASFTLGYASDNGLANQLKSIPKTGDIDIQADFIKGSDKTSLTDDAGEWRLDAAIINIPYVPVLYTDTFTSVHITNEGGSAAEVRATMVTEGGINGADQKVSEEVILGKVPANSVTKFSQTVLADAFGITSKTKMSVTFNIDADDNQVSAYATIQNGSGRTEVSTSRQRDEGVGK